MSVLAYERMCDALLQLNMTRALERVDGLLDRTSNAELTMVEMLDILFNAEATARKEASIARRVSLAGLPAVKTLEQFEFSYQPSLDEGQIRDLHTLRFINDRKNIIFLGQPGVGKTFLSISLAHAAICAGKTVQFTTARQLFSKLRSVKSANRAFARLSARRIDVLVIDEIGYEKLDPTAASHFFRLVCERYQHGSIILTSNKRFSEWGDLIGDQTLATAILDRLLDGATTIAINGPSYRLRDRQRTGTPTPWTSNTTATQATGS